MHFSTSLTVIAATVFVATASSQASTGLPEATINFGSFIPGVTYAPPDKSGLLSNLAAKVSSQVTNTAFKAEVSKISEAKGHNLGEDITKAAAQALWSGTHTTPLPAWLTALPTKGYAYSAINNDINDVFQSEINGATPLKSLASSITAKATSLESSLSSKASSLTSSASSKLSSAESSLGSKASSAVSTATSTGGGVAQAHAQATGGLMAMGAVLGGVLGAGALL